MASPQRAAAGQDKGMEAGEMPATRGVRVTPWHVGSAVPGNKGQFIHILSTALRLGNDRAGLTVHQVHAAHPAAIRESRNGKVHGRVTQTRIQVRPRMGMHGGKARAGVPSACLACEESICNIS